MHMSQPATKTKHRSQLFTRHHEPRPPGVRVAWLRKLAVRELLLGTRAGQEDGGPGPWRRVKQQQWKDARLRADTRMGFGTAAHLHSTCSADDIAAPAGRP